MKKDQDSAPRRVVIVANIGPPSASRDGLLGPKRDWDCGIMPTQFPSIDMASSWSQRDDIQAVVGQALALETVTLGYREHP